MWRGCLCRITGYCISKNAKIGFKTGFGEWYINGQGVLQCLKFINYF